jgi:hypothetical protein
MAGLILLYTHLAYSLNLTDFFGPNAWWDQQQGNKQRREMPHPLTPLRWEVTRATVHVDEPPHRRSTEVEFMRNLPADPAARQAKLRYLKLLFSRTTSSEGRSQEEFLAGTYLINSAGRVNDQQMAQVRKALQVEKFDVKDSPVTFPQFVQEMAPAERLAVWDDVVAFNGTLPSDGLKQEYIVAWLEYYPRQQRMRLYQFLAGELKEGGRDLSLPADPGERAEVLDYLDTWGLDTRQIDTDKGVSNFSFWYHLTDPRAMWAVHIASLIVFALFTVGLYTRVTSVLAWALSLNYIHRSQMTLFGQDTMQTILMTYLMIGPCGAALSLDALRKRYRAALAVMGGGGRSVPWATAALAGPQPSWLANFAIRLVQINFCFIYFSSGFSKLKGTSWWEHSAAWLVMSNPEFGLIRYQAYEWLLRVLVESRFLMALIAGSVTMFTLATEIGLPFLIWTRLRPVMIIFSTLLHFGIAIMMGLTVFGLYMYALLLCYFPAKLLRDRVGWAPGSGRKMTVRYDSRDRTAVRKAAIVRALDIAGQVTFVDAATGKEADRTIRLTDPDGKQVAGSDLYRTAIRELVLLRPVRYLGLIPGVWGLVNFWFGR